ncbi:MAG: citryl-CoA lyase [Spirochaetae bacterium HGW-Spirochaetae-9]|nr:MAG: citryl-CoA lyase [Spirochaetae bacterium HGW-Spirochaetae-9]
MDRSESLLGFRRRVWWFRFGCAHRGGRRVSISTAISGIDSEGVVIRGYSLTELMAKASFAEVLYLVLRGELPDRKTARLIDAILVSAVDHGLNAPSIHIARASASCGVPLSTAVAAGIASIGTNHGGAGEACARFLQEAIVSLPETASEKRSDSLLQSLAEKLVARSLDSGKNLPGYGHRVYKESDPRSAALFKLAKELGLYGDHSRLAIQVAEAMHSAKGKPLVLNVDGAQAAILSDLGFSWKQVQTLFIVGRSLGLCAHVAEELESAVPLGYIKAAPVAAEYSGQPSRSMP